MILGSFSRITSSTKFIPEIDGLRFVAIFMVVIWHCNRNFCNITDFDSNGMLRTISLCGSKGVEVFFVISGFILSLPFAKNRYLGHSAPDLGKYYIRRVTRLEPPYVIALLIFFALKLSTGVISNFSDGFPHFVSSLFYCHNIIYGEASLIHAVAWSLEVEIQFYILTPVLVRVFFLGVTHRWLVFLFIVIIWPFIADQLDFGKYSLLGQIQYFFSGFVLVDIYLLHMNRFRTPSITYDILGVAAIMLFAWVYFRYGEVKSAFAVLIIIFSICAFCGKCLNALLTKTWIITIGGMCYSIYLIHNPMIYLFGGIAKKLIPVHNAWLALAIHDAAALFGILLASAIYFKLVERPCMNPNWVRDLGQKNRR
jgi:peptidoglycan/LPS O-acetylase OafA/YrhL